MLELGLGPDARAVVVAIDVVPVGNRRAEVEAEEEAEEEAEVAVCPFGGFKEASEEASEEAFEEDPDPAGRSSRSWPASADASFSFPAPLTMPPPSLSSARA